VRAPGATRVCADDELLTLAMGNLVTNAAEYADAGSTIVIEARTSNDEPILRIENIASSLVGVDTRRLGDPLWRSDESRAISGHLGMGLSLARAALRATGISLEAGVHAGPPVRFVADLRWLPARSPG
jgi:signal transduction histidine kinase